VQGSEWCHDAGHHVWGVNGVIDWEHETVQIGAYVFSIVPAERKFWKPENMIAIWRAGTYFQQSGGPEVTPDLEEVPFRMMGWREKHREEQAKAWF
jgi:hypothetical protein